MNDDIRDYLIENLDEDILADLNVPIYLDDEEELTLEDIQSYEDLEEYVENHMDGIRDED